jgi:hypothetical protein
LKGLKVEGWGMTTGFRPLAADFCLLAAACCPLTADC